jgi:hypothetical protein
VEAGGDVKSWLTNNGTHRRKAGQETDQHEGVIGLLKVLFLIM